MTLNFTAVDPGGTTGWADFEDDTPVRGGEVSREEVTEFIVARSPDLWVVESYIIRPAALTGGYQHTWNKGEALQIIGMIKAMAQLKGIPVIMQQPSIKPMAAKMAGLPYKKGKKGTHMFDAMLHGTYYWRKNHGPVAKRSTKHS